MSPLQSGARRTVDDGFVQKLRVKRVLKAFYFLQYESNVLGMKITLIVLLKIVEGNI